MEIPAKEQRRTSSGVNGSRRSGGRQLITWFGPWLFIVGYLFWFAGAGLLAPFTADDLMNLHGHLTPSFGRLLLSNLSYWSTTYRPMGGLVYAAAYHLLGFTPFPLRVACFTLLLGNLVLVYRVTERLAESREAALLATMLVTYHAWFVDLYYSSGTIYELLCFAFYFGALCYYIEIRRSGTMLSVWQCVAFLALYVAALDAKEMAVSLPLSIGCYEWIWHRPGRSLRAYQRWLLHEGRVMIAAGLVTVPYVIGKLSGTESLAANPLYRPQISPSRYLHAFNLYLDVLFYQNHFFRPAKTILLILVMGGWAIWSGSRPLRFASAFVLFSVLPFIFIPHYAGIFMYLPSVGWALYAATALVMLTRAHGRPVRLSILFVAVAVVLAPLHARMARQTMEVFDRASLPTREMIAELRRVQPAAPKGARVFFKDDPFPPRTYWLLFLVQLFYDDLTIGVTRAKDGGSVDDRHHDLVLRWQAGRLLVEPE